LIPDGYFSLGLNIEEVAFLFNYLENAKVDAGLVFNHLQKPAVKIFVYL
jgi:hypothetical protein